MLVNFILIFNVMRKYNSNKIKNFYQRGALFMFIFQYLTTN